jgi:hypothetical protein
MSAVVRYNRTLTYHIRYHACRASWPSSYAFSRQINHRGRRPLLRREWPLLRLLLNPKVGGGGLFWRTWGWADCVQNPTVWSSCRSCGLRQDARLRGSGPGMLQSLGRFYYSWQRIRFQKRRLPRCWKCVPGSSPGCVYAGGMTRHKKCRPQGPAKGIGGGKRAASGRTTAVCTASAFDRSRTTRRS